MTRKQHTIRKLLSEGKNYYEVCDRLKINQANLYSTLYYMRKKGIVVSKHISKLGLSPQQRKILELYAQMVPVPQIAKAMQLHCQTVMNHAAEGFKRLSLTVPGVDRITALRAILESGLVVTMDDPFFN